MRRLILVVGLGLCAAPRIGGSSSWAQVPDQGAPADNGVASRFRVFFHADPAIRLLAYESVREDLKLTGEQKRRIQELSDLIKKKQASLDKHPGNRLASAGPTLAAEPTKGANGDLARKQGAGSARLSFLDEQEAIEKETEQKSNQILTKSQRLRLGQIELQRRGPIAIIEDTGKFVEKLGLDDEQVEQIRALEGSLLSEKRKIVAQFRADVKSGPKPSAESKKGENPDPKAREVELQKSMTARITANADRGNEQVLRILTGAQRGLYRKMIGKTFDTRTLKGEMAKPG